MKQARSGLSNFIISETNAFHQANSTSSAMNATCGLPAFTGNRVKQGNSLTTLQISELVRLQAVGFCRKV
jgi:hypothetical protein